MMQAQDAFFSPTQTPQGSPSKKQAPPGAFDLPDAFASAMKLLPSNNASNKGAGSPGKGLQSWQDQFQDAMSPIDGKDGRPTSPTRKSNQENTPPARPNLQKDASYLSQAAASRQDPYRTHDRPASPSRQPFTISPTQEEIEKLQKPNVRRLANVTQLCTFSLSSKET